MGFGVFEGMGGAGGGGSPSTRNKLGKHATHAAKLRALAVVAIRCGMQKCGFLVFGEPFSIVSGVV